ncbi:MAG TPA: protein phosphatase 2C domain-containing protein [Acidimicrobiales bacterium]|nr:protein phosphatase 2C domain-containing protein [Acidimicrobiales bacterium]
MTTDQEAEPSEGAGAAAFDRRRTARPPVFGRPSPAAEQPARLRERSGGLGFLADGGDDGPWALRAASVAGVRHRLAGEAGQDAFAWRLVDAGGRSWLVLAVADGLGSVPGSAAAATAATRAVADALAARLGAGDEPRVDRSWWAPLYAEAAGAVTEAGGATTLVAVAIDADGAGVAARVGDSTALLLAGGSWAPVWPLPTIDPDAPVEPKTPALPSTVEPEVGAVNLDEGAALVLVTDGVADPLADGPTTVAPALAAGLAEPVTPLQLAVLADFSRRGCFDDRTILAVWRRGAGA